MSTRSVSTCVLCDTSQTLRDHLERRHVENTLRALMKGVQGSGEVPEENLDDVVSEHAFDEPHLWLTLKSSKGCARSVKDNIWKSRGPERRAERRYVIVLHRSQLSSLIPLLTYRGGKARAGADDEDAESVDSMLMDVDEPDSDLDLDSARKRSTTARGKKAAATTASRKKASGSGKKKDIVSRASLSAITMWFMQL
jgi:double-strand break repair protein MRE11